MGPIEFRYPHGNQVLVGSGIRRFVGISPTIGSTSRSDRSGGRLVLHSRSVDPAHGPSLSSNLVILVASLYRVGLCGGELSL